MSNHALKYRPRCIHGEISPCRVCMAQALTREAEEREKEALAKCAEFAAEVARLRALLSSEATHADK